MDRMNAINFHSLIDHLKLSCVGEQKSPEQEVGMAKSAVFGVMHLGIAFGVSYTLTGSVAVAGAITLVEPLCNTVAHYFFDRWWERRRTPRAARPDLVGATG
jgi:uncharacterized membrane protein